MALSASPFVQVCTGFLDNSASAPTATFDANVTAGNMIVVGVSTDGGATRTVTPTDSLGNTYVQAGSYATNGTSRISLWYAKNISGGACTVTVTPNTTAFTYVHAAEYSGLDATAPLDGNAGSTGNSTTITTGSITVSNTGELVVGALVTVGSSKIVRPAAGFGMRAANLTSSVGGFVLLDGVFSVATAALMKSSAANNFAAAGASFKAAAGGGGGTSGSRSRTQ